MRAYPIFVWFTGIGLLFLILLRGILAKTLFKYHFFFVYVVAMVVSSIVLWVVSARTYASLYWALQFITLLIGCGIILEIFKHVLAPYPGADRFATAVSLVTFGLVFCFALIFRGFGSGSEVELERNVRTIQALFLFAIFAVISYYGIPIGRNLKGMIGGYGLYIGTSLVSLAFNAYSANRFSTAWHLIQPSSYDASLLVWLVSLWSYSANPAPEAPILLEEDYEEMAARTKRALGAMWGRLR